MSRRAPRILFVLKYREQPYDAQGWGDEGSGGKHLSSGLFNSARMVCDMLVAEGYQAELVHVVDNNAIHREIVRARATHVIVEAFWVVPEKFDELRRACPDVHFIVRNHSETPFLANEGIAFDWTLKYAQRSQVAISCNAPRMLRDTRALIAAKMPWLSDEQVIEKTPYLPNFYPTPDRAPPAPTHPRRGRHLDVGCFGAVRPLKNHMTQAVAAIDAAEALGLRLRFHVNAGRAEQGGSPIVKNLYQLFDLFGGKHRLVDCPWRPHDAFRTLVAQMDLVSQVSFTETFNIVAADAVTQGVPTVTSREIPWSSRLFRADPTSAPSITRAMLRAMEVGDRLPRFNPSLCGLRRYDDASRMCWSTHFGAPRG